MNFDDYNNRQTKITLTAEQQQKFADAKTQVMPRELLEKLQQQTAEPAAVRRRRRTSSYNRSPAAPEYPDADSQRSTSPRRPRSSYYLRALLLICLVLGSAAAGYFVSAGLSEDKQSLENQSHKELQAIEQQKTAAPPAAAVVTEPTEQKEEKAADKDKADAADKKTTGKDESAKTAADKTDVKNPTERAEATKETTKAAAAAAAADIHEPTTPPQPDKANNKAK